MTSIVLFDTCAVLVVVLALTFTLNANLLPAILVQVEYFPKKLIISVYQTNLPRIKRFRFLGAFDGISNFM